MCYGRLAKLAAKIWASRQLSSVLPDGEDDSAEGAALNREAYFPVNTALRFSMKACTASR